MRERERIARELHDTFLQGAQALLLVVHALSLRLQPDNPNRELVTETVQRADALMAQGRDRIQNLRSGSNAGVDLAQALASAWRDLGSQKEFRIVVQGEARDLEPNAGNEIALIGREALTNAVRHSKATAIEARVMFCDDALQLHVRDNGVGLEKAGWPHGSISGHWGLSGMRERARRVSAHLVISSETGSGTEIGLTVPSAYAYR